MAGGWRGVVGTATGTVTVVWPLRKMNVTSIVLPERISSARFLITTVNLPTLTGVVAVGFGVVVGADGDVVATVTVPLPDGGCEEPVVVVVDVPVVVGL